VHRPTVQQVCSTETIPKYVSISTLFRHLPKDVSDVRKKNKSVNDTTISLCVNNFRH